MISRTYLPGGSENESFLSTFTMMILCFYSVIHFSTIIMFIIIIRCAYISLYNMTARNHELHFNLLTDFFESYMSKLFWSRWSCHDVIFNVCVIIDERGQDGYFGRTAVLHPDQHPLWRRTSHRAPAPSGSRSVFGSYFICIWQWFLSWGFSQFMLGLTSGPHFL